MAPRPRALAHRHSEAWHRAVGDGLDAELAVATAMWLGRNPAATTQARVGDLLVRFAAWLRSAGVTSLTDVTIGHCDAFVAAPTRRRTPPAAQTMDLRRTAIRALYREVRELDPSIEDPTRHLELPSRTRRGTRPLTDHEIERVRTTAIGDTRNAARTSIAVALAESTATTGEIAHLRWVHVDLAAHTVALPGASPVTARHGRLNRHAHQTLIRHRPSDATADAFVLPATNTGQHATQAAITNLFRRLLLAAGLTDAAVRPSSIRLWAARTILRDDGIEAAARALGLNSLDAVAEALGHDWHQT
jgi:site-specific recombinase XerD